MTGLLNSLQVAYRVLIHCLSLVETFVGDIQSGTSEQLADTIVALAHGITITTWVSSPFLEPSLAESVRALLPCMDTNSTHCLQLRKFLEDF